MKKFNLQDVLNDITKSYFVTENRFMIGLYFDGDNEEPIFTFELEDLI